MRLPSGEKLTVWLALLEESRLNDTIVTSNPQHPQALVQMARDFTRTHAIGKAAQMYRDGHRDANKGLGLDARWPESLERCLSSCPLDVAFICGSYCARSRELGIQPKINSHSAARAR